ncbi:hypothetical protein HIM_11809 [Hirsutella minnesotensis 3608]|uniref:Uncharacterized protein n=1 Tax=Hirsutella minnesotensis 3608 TaxID=1043627 RepID=A0A0F7ZIQ8_9HYPO|nr:hypothetical protein HIM_11809 [Hirsutella minnesotensis 3608]
MSEVQQQEKSTEDSEGDLPQSQSPSIPTGGRKPANLAMQQTAVAEDAAENGVSPRANRGRRIVPVHESRIKDRPEKQGEKDSSLKIKIELDLEVEVDIYARVKGDVTIGLM